MGKRVGNITVAWIGEENRARRPTHTALGGLVQSELTFIPQEMPSRK